MTYCGRLQNIGNNIRGRQMKKLTKTAIALFGDVYGK